MILLAHYIMRRSINISKTERKKIESQEKEFDKWKMHLAIWWLFDEENHKMLLVPGKRMAAVAEWYRYRIVVCLVTSSSPVPLKTRRVGQRCTLNLWRAETSSRWCGVVVKRGWCQLRCRPRHLTMVQNYVVRCQKPSCS
ncbi:uncharacterized protein TNCV_2570561 [Trichonephila clavipes]|nr:uncharacterized protein TNCV_2570561 [Trichonephila clavipes]